MARRKISSKATIPYTHGSYAYYACIANRWATSIRQCIGTPGTPELHELIKHAQRSNQLPAWATGGLRHMRIEPANLLAARVVTPNRVRVQRTGRTLARST
jgi:hypothetical protein